MGMPWHTHLYSQAEVYSTGVSHTYRQRLSFFVLKMRKIITWMTAFIREMTELHIGNILNGCVTL